MELLKMNRHFHKLKIQPYSTNGGGGGGGPGGGSFGGINFNSIKNLNWEHWKATIEKHLKNHTKMDLDSLKETIKSIGLFLGKSSSPIFAQRICRSYQILHLHSRLWSTYIGTTIGSLPPAGKTSSRILVSKLGPKPWFLSFIIFSLYDQNDGKSKESNNSRAIALIEESELFDHMGDLDYIHELTTSTIICPDCNHRLVVDKKIRNVQYCRCSSNRSSSAIQSDFNGKKWSPFVETPDLLIWRQPHETNHELYKYKVYGQYNDITPRDFLVTQLDLDYRKKWDTLVLNLEVIDYDDKNGIDIVYWEMKWPKMFSNRDYCFARRFIVNEEDGTIIIMNKSIKHSKVPEKTGAYRVKEYTSVMQIRGVNGLDEPGVEFGLTYYDNPGLSLPGWLLNWAAITAIPDFLSKVHNAARVRRRSESEQKLSTNSEIQHQNIDLNPKETQKVQCSSMPALKTANATSVTVESKSNSQQPQTSPFNPQSRIQQQSQSINSNSQPQPTKSELFSKFLKENMATFSEAWN